MVGEQACSCYHKSVPDLVTNACLTYITQVNSSNIVLWEIITLDAGQRMDGIPALDLWDLVTEVLHSSSNQTKTSIETVQGNLLHDTPSRNHTKNQVNTPTSTTILSYATSIISPQT